MGLKTIIIADDEPHLVHVVAFNLRKTGATVHSAANGKECVELAMKIVPDLIVSDYQMPVLDGLKAAIQLRQDPRTAHVPLLMLTARGHRLTPDELGQTNIVAVLPKPFSARELVARVEQLLTVRGIDKAAA